MTSAILALLMLALIVGIGVGAVAGLVISKTHSVNREGDDPIDAAVRGDG